MLELNVLTQKIKNGKKVTAADYRKLVKLVKNKYYSDIDNLKNMKIDEKLFDLIEYLLENNKINTLTSVTSLLKILEYRWWNNCENEINNIDEKFIILKRKGVLTLEDFEDLKNKIIEKNPLLIRYFKIKNKLIELKFILSKKNTSVKLKNSFEKFSKTIDNVIYDLNDFTIQLNLLNDILVKNNNLKFFNPPLSYFQSAADYFLYLFKKKLNLIKKKNFSNNETYQNHVINLTATYSAALIHKFFQNEKSLSNIEKHLKLNSNSSPYYSSNIFIIQKLISIIKSIYQMNERLNNLIADAHEDTDKFLSNIKLNFKHTKKQHLILLRIIIDILDKIYDNFKALKIPDRSIYIKNRKDDKIIQEFYHEIEKVLNVKNLIKLTDSLKNSIKE